VAGITVMGIDPSLRSTGVAVLGCDPDRVYSIKTSRLNQADAIGMVADKILKEARDVDFTFIEGYAFGKFGGSSSVSVLIELSGVIKYELRKLGYKFIVVPPTVVKKYLTGSGNSNKDKMMLSCYRKFGLEFETSDECDAYALADLGYHTVSHEPRRNLTKAELEVIQRVRDDGQF
jgi:crossover junction endodeoxyribonuclease RuvC